MSLLCHNWWLESHPESETASKKQTVKTKNTKNGTMISYIIINMFIGLEQLISPNHTQ